MVRRDPYRSTNASKATDELAARELGYKSQRDLDRDRQQANKYTDDAARRAIILPSHTLTFSRATLTGTTTTALMRNPLAGSGTATRFPMAAAGRVIGASIWSSTSWVAGTAQLQVRFSRGGGTESTLVIPEPCLIDGNTGDDAHARTASASWICPVRNGIPFARGDDLRLVIVLTSWSGSTDFSADLLVTYDGLS
jgi:hypothetical protein